MGGAGGHVQPRLGHAVLLLHHYLAGLLRRLEGDGLGGVRRRYAHLAENSGRARLGFVLCRALVCPPCSKQWAGKVRFCVVCGSGMATSLKTVGGQGSVLCCVLPTSLKTVGGQGCCCFLLGAALVVSNFTLCFSLLSSVIKDNGKSALCSKLSVFLKLFSVNQD